MDSQVAKLRKYMKDSHYTVAITGAGISFSIGVINMKKRINTLKLLPIAAKNTSKRNPKYYYKALDAAFLHPMFHNGPSVAHKALVELENRDMLQGIITTNVDCLHTIAGSKHVAEIQGSLGINRCVECGRHYDDYNIWTHGEMPRCQECGNPVEAYPFYSRASLENKGLSLARTWISQAELILVIGANGSYGSTYLNNRNPKAKIIQINPNKTQFDGMAEFSIKKDADSVFGELMNEI